MAQIPVKSVTSQQESQPSPATLSFMNHPDIVQIRERFNHEMSKMRQQTATMIQDMFGFFAEEIEQVTIRIWAAQEQHADRSFPMTEPKEEPNECTVEEVPLSISQYIRSTHSKEVVEFDRETEIDRDNELIEDEDDTETDRDNEMIEIEDDTEIDYHHGIEIDDQQDGEIDEGSEMNIGQNGENKSSHGIETISHRCDINGCEYMAGRNQIVCHKREMHGVLRYQCRICSPIISFDNKQHLGDHIQLEHSRLTDFRCDQCARTFSSYSSYTTHKYRYHDTGLFRCSASDCAFEHTIRHQVHDHIRHQHKQYECKFAGCGQSFCNIFNLRQHERIHLQVRPYSCAFSDHCNFASTQRGNVIKHIRSVHFHLPRSEKKQRELNIIDQRDASVYLRVDQDLLRMTMDSTPDPNQT